MLVVSNVLSWDLYDLYNLHDLHMFRLVGSVRSRSYAQHFHIGQK